MRKKWSWLQIITHIGALIPLGLMLWDYWYNQLTINPIQELTFRTGWYALFFLILSLVCTPLNTLFKFRQAILLRRPLGLYSFFYATLHFLIFIGLDFGFNLELILENVFKKPFALVGFSAFLILLPLAITSTKGWMKRLGRNWKRLHRLVYLAAGLAIVHFIMLVKSDIREPVLYGTIIAILLSFRLPWLRKKLKKVRLGESLHRFQKLVKEH